jgi:hypothetical protein
MCTFLSGIAQRNGDVIALPEATHSHSDLIRYLGLKDENPELRQWVRVEFSPSQASELDEVDKYKLTLDDIHPVWWDDVQETVEKNMRRMVTQIIIAEDRDIVLGGFWIVGKMWGSSQVRRDARNEATKKKNLVRVAETTA